MEQKPISRDRTIAVYDKKQSIVNYLKLHNEDENKVKNLKRLTSVKDGVDLNQILKEVKKTDMNFPKPPWHSNETKNYKTERNRLYIHQKAVISDSFDQYEILNSSIPLISLELYLSKFGEDELENMKLKDILTFDSSLYDSIKLKLLELKEVAQKVNDNQIHEFLNYKINMIDSNKKNIDILVNNLEKIEDFVILEETIKFFLKKSSVDLAKSI